MSINGRHKSLVSAALAAAALALGAISMVAEAQIQRARTRVSADPTRTWRRV